MIGMVAEEGRQVSSVVTAPWALSCEENSVLFG